MKEQFVDLHVKEGIGEIYAYYDGEIWFSYNDLSDLLGIVKTTGRYIIREVVSDCDKNIANIRRNNDILCPLREEIFVNLNAISDIITYCKKKYEHRLNTINDFVHDIATQYDNWNYEEPDDPGLKQSVQMLDKLVPEDSYIRVWVDSVIESNLIQNAINQEEKFNKEIEEIKKVLSYEYEEDPHVWLDCWEFEEFIKENPEQAVLRKRQ